MKTLPLLILRPVYWALCHQLYWDQYVGQYAISYSETSTLGIFPWLPITDWYWWSHSPQNHRSHQQPMANRYRWEMLNGIGQINFSTAYPRLGFSMSALGFSFSVSTSSLKLWKVEIYQIKWKTVSHLWINPQICNFKFYFSIYPRPGMSDWCWPVPV